MSFALKKSKHKAVKLKDRFIITKEHNLISIIMSVIDGLPRSLHELAMTEDVFVDLQ